MIKQLNRLFVALLAFLLVFSPLADAAQITRQHSDTIANGNLANATDVSDELNSLVNESNSQDTRLTNIESGNQTISGNKTFTGTTTFSGTNSFTSTTTLSGTVNFTGQANHARASDPGTPVEGDFWYNSTSHVFKYRDNSATVTVPNISPMAGILTKSGSYTTVAADKGYLLSGTSTWTLTYTAAATLGSGWFEYIRNDGTGAITLDPNGSETVDGATTMVVYPGEAFTVVCDGSNFKTVGRQKSGWILLGSSSASSSTTIDFTSFIGSDFDEYILLGEYVLPATDGVDAYVRFSTDGGSSFMASTQYGYTQIGVDGTAVGSAGTSQIKLDRQVIGNADGEGLDFEVHFTKPSGGQAVKSLRWNSNERGTATSAEGHFGSGIVSTASAINGVRFLFSSGNISQGSFKLYGVRK